MDLPIVLPVTIQLSDLLDWTVTIHATETLPSPDSLLSQRKTGPAQVLRLPFPQAQIIRRDII